MRRFVLCLILCYFVLVFFSPFSIAITSLGDLFVLRFYGLVNPMGSCRARPVYLTTRLLGRLSPLGEERSNLSAFRTFV